MTASEFDSKDLTAERSLWDIYRASRVLPTNGFNKISTAIVAGLLILQCLLGKYTSSSTVELIRSAADAGLPVALSTLGLLLAGFTIFSTVSQPSLLLRMAGMTHPASGLSWLKCNYFVFMRVFIYYLVFSVFCLFIIVFGRSGGLVSVFVSCFSREDVVRFVIVNVSYILFFSFSYFLIVQLKSFVFNVYHAVMTSLRWEAEGCSG